MYPQIVPQKSPWNSGRGPEFAWTWMNPEREWNVNETEVKQEGVDYMPLKWICIILFYGWFYGWSTELFRIQMHMFLCIWGYGGHQIFRLVVIFAVILFIQICTIECLSVLLKWMLPVIFLCCRTVIPLFYPLSQQTFGWLSLPEISWQIFFRYFSVRSSRSCWKCVTGFASISYTICIVIIQLLSTNHPNFHQPWGSSSN